MNATIFWLTTVVLIYWLPIFAQNPFQPGAKWIQEENAMPGACQYYKRDFRVSQRPVKATLIITCHGLYFGEINEKRVSADLFTPGFTSYHQRLQYQTYDITHLLRFGANELVVTIGPGWYCGKFGPDLKENIYGNNSGLLAQIKLTYSDGRGETITTDTSWQCTLGPIRYSDLYSGETQDTRIKPGPWRPVIVTDISKSNLVPGICEPVQEHENFHPVRILTTTKGEKVLDFGQNLAGWVRFMVKGKSGDTIRLTHAETLDSAGNFFMGNLRLAKAEDIYVLNGQNQILSPHFTYHGFRYVRLEGYPGPVNPKNFSAVALYSGLRTTGYFRCSNPMINQLQSNIDWSQRSNFFDIPTDCPQRSERFGWTGDAQVFCRTASFNQDVKAFFLKWLADLAVQQGANGGLPVIIPDFLHPDSVSVRSGVAGWGDAATIIPWTLYEVYGDTSILRQQYASMKAWVDYIRSQAAPDGMLWKADGYGDWYAPLGPTDLPYIDECFFAHSTELLTRTAAVLGKTDDSIRYTRLLDTIKQTFMAHYVPLSKTQTACVLALQFDLLPDSMRASVAQHLASLIDANNDHLATGFLGTPYLLPVLTRFGYTDLAFTILNQTTPPSWLYPITKGATTIWEKWDAIKPDGTFDTASLNHYSFGAVGEWLYRRVAGIDAAEPGYHKILINPHVGGGLRWVKASYNCPYGTIISNWKVKRRRLKMETVIPPNTTAIVLLPDSGTMTSLKVGPGHHYWTLKLTN